ncbi:unnamed protein product [Arabidopsis arenosa]|uniref:Uncharacterized protein n=1 Tax=Arabidopsis arenosa TaxID=38785 RepID=A0A8S2ARN0_ARAAE|nr:unnamed protein product [Arabidopsis arenosa]
MKVNRKAVESFTRHRLKELIEEARDELTFVGKMIVFQMIASAKSLRMMPRYLNMFRSTVPGLFLRSSTRPQSCKFRIQNRDSSC